LGATLVLRSYFSGFSSSYKSISRESTRFVGDWTRSSSRASQFELEAFSTKIFAHLLETKLCISTPYKNFALEVTSLELLLSVIEMTTMGATKGGLESTIFTFLYLS